MICSKKELKYYIMADTMMNKGVFSIGVKARLKSLFLPNTLSFLKSLRYMEYYINNNKKTLGRFFWSYRFQKLGIRFGFSIACNVFGYGLVIPHYGTIVVGKGNKIGNFAVLHTSTCISEGKKVIGDGFYVSSGAKIINDFLLGDGVSVSANSLLNKANGESNVLFAGMPAIGIKDSLPWYLRDNSEYARRVKECKKLFETL